RRGGPRRQPGASATAAGPYPGRPPWYLPKCARKPRPDIYIRSVDGDASGWFRGAGLGLFVHWDHASQQGLELSWPLVGGIPVLPKCQSVPVADYHASAATFDPKAWDPAALARRAKACGMTYAVFTAKHHN